MTGRRTSPTRRVPSPAASRADGGKPVPTCCSAWPRAGSPDTGRRNNVTAPLSKAPGPPATVGATPSPSTASATCSPCRAQPLLPATATRRASPCGATRATCGGCRGCCFASAFSPPGSAVSPRPRRCSRSPSNGPRRSGSVKAPCSPSWVSVKRCTRVATIAMPPAGSPTPWPRPVSWKRTPAPASRWPAWPASPWPAVTSTAAARWLNEPEADAAGDPQRAVATRAALLRARAALAAAGGDNQRAEALHLEALRLRRLLGDNRAIIEQLEAVAIDALGQGRNSRAATLLAAAARWRTAMGFPVPTRDRQAVNDAAPGAHYRRRHARRGVAHGPGTRARRRRHTGPRRCARFEVAAAPHHPYHEGEQIGTAGPIPAARRNPLDVCHEARATRFEPVEEGRRHMHLMQELLVDEHIRRASRRGRPRATSCDRPSRRPAVTRRVDLAPTQPTCRPPDAGSDPAGAHARRDDPEHLTRGRTMIFDPNLAAIEAHLRREELADHPPPQRGGARRAEALTGAARRGVRLLRVTGRSLTVRPKDGLERHSFSRSRGRGSDLAEAGDDDGPGW